MPGGVALGSFGISFFCLGPSRTHELIEFGFDLRGDEVVVGLSWGRSVVRAREEEGVTGWPE